ncbi:lantibiotic ABC transporter ATP-binding protein [Leuconostoc mesenteroides P45]|uniref:ATP-binding cassette domain-containing protein n=1 Tax=Leuconostoc mesenteroides TaxID=1245 RepID=UPI00050351C5|nr:ATP-binding cassette domain-containing protein [Leuconostoc mesenteroides]KGB50812.1 lantibiotic ABC transporter ATP-binding protein [Leuconostoc mesenteroides P45]
MEVSIKNVSKQFKNKQVLRDVSFTIESGSVCGLLGINGAGKSTLMKLLYGLEQKDQGQISYDGRIKTKRENIGALIENPAIYNNLSAFDNLMTKALLFNIGKERIRQTLSIVGLSNTGKTRAGKFSIGMKQRLGIGMAILTRPDFLILDEPTNGLDPDGREELINLIIHLKRGGVTILISSHLLNEIHQVTDKIVILNDGIIALENKNDDSVDIEKIFFSIVHGGK